jgi:hypothetical protein
MVVSGLPERTPDHAGNVASLGLDLLDAVKNFRCSPGNNQKATQFGEYVNCN